jgi:hypothetical protein
VGSEGGGGGRGREEREEGVAERDDGDGVAAKGGGALPRRGKEGVRGRGDERRAGSSLTMYLLTC